MSSPKTRRHVRASLTRVEAVANRIYVIRGQKIMLSIDLAELSGVQPKALIQAVKRNDARFPEDFMFQLSDDAIRNLMRQNQSDSRKQIGFRSTAKKRT